MDGAAGRIEYCTETGLWLLPRSGEGLTRYFPSWDHFTPALRAVQLEVLAAARAEDRRSGSKPREQRYRVKLGLLPMPDIDYSDRAVAVVRPNGPAEPLMAADQVAWVKHDHTQSLQPSIVGLAALTGAAVGCHAVFDLDPYDHEEDRYGDFDDAEASEDPSLFPRDLAREYGYWIDKPRGDIATWSVVREQLLLLLSEREPDRIIPIVSHRSAWAIAASDPLRERLRQIGRFDVTLMANDDELAAYYGDVRIATPSNDRDFFYRTWDRVLDLGGATTARAHAHEGSLTIYVEDSRPEDDDSWG
jgi:hypothetical protein